MLSLLGVCAVAFGFAPAVAGATIVLGDPLAPTSSNSFRSCGLTDGGPPCTLIQTALTESGAQLAAPVDGVIDSATIDVVGSTGSGYLALRVMRPAGGGQFAGAGTSQHIQTSTTGVGQFAITPSLTVRAGDTIGLDMTQSGSGFPSVRFDTGGSFAPSTFAVWQPALADGSTAAPTSTGTNTELRFNAALEPARPVVGAVGPASGPTAGGTPVTITGDHLIGVSAVSFGSAPASSFTIASDTQITATAPPGAAGSVPVTVTGPGGQSASGPVFTYVATHVAPIAPRLARVFQTARTWRGGSALPRFARKRTPPVGTTFGFTLDQPATVRLAFTQTRSGRRVAGRCVAQTARNRRKPRCRRAITVAVLRRNAAAGARTVRFQGRVSRTKRLRPGRYTLVITATNSAGLRSSQRSLTFTIVKP